MGAGRVMRYIIIVVGRSDGSDVFAGVPKD